MNISKFWTHVNLDAILSMKNVDTTVNLHITHSQKSVRVMHSVPMVAPVPNMNVKKQQPQQQRRQQPRQLQQPLQEKNRKREFRFRLS